MGAGRGRRRQLARVGAGGDGRGRAPVGGGALSARRLPGAHLPAASPERRDGGGPGTLGCQAEFAVDVRLPLPVVCRRSPSPLWGRWRSTSVKDTAAARAAALRECGPGMTPAEIEALEQSRAETYSCRRACEGPAAPPLMGATAPTAPGPPAARWTASGRSASDASRWRVPCALSTGPCRARSCLPPTRPPPDSPAVSAPGSWPPGRDRHDAGAPARRSAPAPQRAVHRSPVAGRRRA